MAEDKARDRVESGDSGRECNAVIRPQGPDATRMEFFNGLLCLSDDGAKENCAASGRVPYIVRGPDIHWH